MSTYENGARSSHIIPDWEAEAQRAHDRVKHLEHCMNLVLLGESIPHGITTAKNEIENVYGEGYVNWDYMEPHLHMESSIFDGDES